MPYTLEVNSYATAFDKFASKIGSDQPESKVYAKLEFPKDSEASYLYHHSLKVIKQQAEEIATLRQQLLDFQQEKDLDTYPPRKRKLTHKGRKPRTPHNIIAQYCVALPEHLSPIKVPSHQPLPWDSKPILQESTTY